MADKIPCPNCGSNLNKQRGFNSDEDTWTCTSCGMKLFGPDAAEGERFEDVFWVCDKCGASLNSQAGFSDTYDCWQCRSCGFVNRISEDDILNEGEEWDYSEVPDNASGFWDYIDSNSAMHDSPSQDSNDDWSWNDDDDDDNYDDDDGCDDDDDYYFDSSTTHQTREQAKALKDLNDEIARNQKLKARADRREFTKRHRKGIIIAFGLFIILCVFVFVGFEYQKLRTVGISSSEAVGEPYEFVLEKLQDAGFTNVSSRELYDLVENNLEEDGMVNEVLIAGKSSFDADSKFPADTIITVRYHSVSLAFPPYRSSEVAGEDYLEVEQQFRDAGFCNIRFEARNDSLIGVINKVNAVNSVSIDGDKRYPDDQEFRIDADVLISYHTPVFGE